MLYANVLASCVSRQLLTPIVQAAQIEAIDPDILCIQEGPSTGNIGRLEAFCADMLGGRWTVIKRPPDESYLISGSQGIYFLVRTSRLAELAPHLLPNSQWIPATEAESRIDPFAEGTG